MIKRLHEEGTEFLKGVKGKFKTDEFDKIKTYFDQQMEAAKKAVKENITLKEKKPPLPDVGQFISFQGKGTPYGDI